MKYPKELAGLRGLAAAYVLMRHSLEILPPPSTGRLFDYGYAVSLFMIVSGFSIYWLLDTRSPTYARFITERAFRIFPVYLLGLAVSTLMLDFVWQTFSAFPPVPGISSRLQVVELTQHHLGAHLFAHLTMLHGMIPESLLSNSSYSIIGQAWSLSVEWQLYLVMPLAIGWISTLDRRMSQLRLVAFVLGLLWCGTYLPGGFLGNNLTMFSLGIASYAVVKRFRDDERTLSACMAGLVSLAAIWDVRTLPSAVIWAVIISSAVTVRRGRLAALVSRGLCSRTAQYLGRVSYPFYIFHMVALVLCLRVIHGLGMRNDLRCLALPIAAFALTVIFAELVHRLIERPFYSLGKALSAQLPTLRREMNRFLAVELTQLCGRPYRSLRRALGSIRVANGSFRRSPNLRKPFEISLLERWPSGLRQRS